MGDADAVRDDVRALIGARLGHPDGVLSGDETGVVNKGTALVGVARQDTGTASRIDNSQVAVVGGDAWPRGRAWIDRRRYLPRQSWCADRDRRRAAGVPDEVKLATMPQRAAEIISAALDAGVPARQLTADEGYGDHRVVRAGWRGRRVGYLLAVGGTTCIDVPVGRCRADALIAGWPSPGSGPAPGLGRKDLAAMPGPGATWLPAATTAGARPPPAPYW